MFMLLWDIMVMGCGVTLFVTLLKGGFKTFVTILRESGKLITKAIANLFELLNGFLD